MRWLSRRRQPSHGSLRRIGQASILYGHFCEADQFFGLPGRAGDDVRGDAMNVALGAVEHANVGDVLVSRTVKVLAAGSGVAFEYLGTHRLPGVGGGSHLYRVVA